MAEANDLWPEFGQIEKIRSPKTIMIEQANFLNEKTKNVLSAKVETSSSSTSSQELIQFFKIYVPALNNYNFSLFYVRHKVIFYPLVIGLDGVQFPIDDEPQFVEKLIEIFNSTTTLKIIRTLYSQAVE
ncbi:hypothetical protein [Ferruginibacter sp.]